MEENIDKKVEKNNRNKKSFIAIIALIVLLIGSTYAWYVLTIKGTNENVIKAGKLSLVLDESESIAIDLNNSVPLTDEEGLTTSAYTFKLKNDGDISSNYTIYLDDVELESGETRMLDKYIKYSLTKDGTPAVTALLPTIGINPNRVLVNGIIEADTTHIYTLRLWIDKDADDGVMNTTFRGKLRVEAAQATGMICRRATTLHTEVCSQTDVGCRIDGIETNDKITYGNLGTNGALTTGDAFDCDVDGSGTYDESGSNNNGPITTKLQLPSTIQWPNVSLTNTTRAITNENGGTTTSAGDLPTAFSYEGYAARLLTYQELDTGCYDGLTLITSVGGLSKKCKFLFENTQYSNDLLKRGYWLENPRWSELGAARSVSGYFRYVGFISVTNDIGYGVRPVIEVPKSDILY